MKILNLYAGIGGNRKLWQGDLEITAIENVPEIAKIYQDFFPNDKVIIADAHQYLLDYFKEFDFIWSSPPCPTHSRFNFLNNLRVPVKYPNMELYEEIILLKTWYKGKYCVENVISYYDPLIAPQKIANHYFWANFIIPQFDIGKRNIRNVPNHIQKRSEQIGFPVKDLKIKSDLKRKILNNCVEPETGLHIFESAFRETKTLF